MCCAVYCAFLCCAVLCHTVLCCALLCCAVQFLNTVLCFAVLCCAVLCCAVLCCAVLEMLAHVLTTSCKTNVHSPKVIFAQGHSSRKYLPIFATLSHFNYTLKLLGCQCMVLDIGNAGYQESNCRLSGALTLRTI